jgi:hypothetical protein
MRHEYLRELMVKVKKGQIEVDDAINMLKTLPYEDIGFAKVDNHRSIRQGAPEIIFGEGKTPEQIISIIRVLTKGGNDAIVTRTTREVFRKVKAVYKRALYNEQARMIVVRKTARQARKNKGIVLIISAGTSDIPVAEEAAVTAETMGNKVERLYDVGIAGIHRLLDNIDIIKAATVLVVVAGMEGALPSIVGGLVDRPVIAVPTSVGYGASFGGIAALLGMLNSCASGVSVVNIDNGFGAGYMANLINSLQG